VGFAPKYFNRQVPFDGPFSEFVCFIMFHSSQVGIHHGNESLPFFHAGFMIPFYFILFLHGLEKIWLTAKSREVRRKVSQRKNYTLRSFAVYFARLCG
jgi:hypothetical protein